MFSNTHLLTYLVRVKMDLPKRNICDARLLRLKADLLFPALPPATVHSFKYFNRTSEGLRNRLVAGEQKKAHYVEMILTGWDHAIYNGKTVGTKQIALYREALVSTISLFCISYYGHKSLYWNWLKHKYLLYWCTIPFRFLILFKWSWSERNGVSMTIHCLFTSGRYGWGSASEETPWHDGVSGMSTLDHQSCH